MIKEKIAESTKSAIEKLFGGTVQAFPEILIEKPANPQFGDYAVNVAFALAKQLGKSPQEVAGTLANEITKNKPVEIERVEAVGGYVNFFLDACFVRNQLVEIYKNRDSFGRSDIGRGQKVIVEYSSVNIAKPMHAGHLRTTLLGDAIANILAFQGYKVIRWNYLGDWGTQFGKVIAAYKRWGDEKRVKADPIKNLVELYVRFNQEAESNQELEKEGQEEFKKLENGDKDNRRLWKLFVKKTLNALKKIYADIDVRFDVFIGESFYEPGLKKLVDELINKEAAKTGEGGAIIIDLEKYGLPPSLIRKSDGATLYMTRDLANLEYRLSKFKPDKILYVVADEQALHFKQLFAIAQVLGLNTAELRHINYGLILGEDNKKLSTRKGKIITADGIIEESIEKTAGITREKNKGLAEKQYREISKAVGIGALKYAMLKDNASSNIVFDWQKILDFRGNSGPYLQYTYARLLNITAKAGKIARIPTLSRNKAGLNELKTVSELAIIKHLMSFPEVIADSAHSYLTNNLALYLYELANLANQFYESTPILKDENIDRRNARLALILTITSIFKTGLGLLGIRVLEKM